MTTSAPLAKAISTPAFWADFYRDYPPESTKNELSIGLLGRLKTLENAGYSGDCLFQLIDWRDDLPPRIFASSLPDGAFDLLADGRNPWRRIWIRSTRTGLDIVRQYDDGRTDRSEYRLDEPITDADVCSLQLDVWEAQGEDFLRDSARVTEAIAIEQGLATLDAPLVRTPPPPAKKPEPTYRHNPVGYAERALQNLTSDSY